MFLKIGLIGFGGPAAHVALMRRELVERRGWVREDRFLELFAVSNLVPGPGSTEMALILGLEQGGWPALALAGLLFVLPAAVMVLALAWAYVRFGSLPQLGWVLYGITPVVVGVVLDALWQMGRSALWRPDRSLLTRSGLVALAATSTALYLLGVTVVAILLGGGLLVVVATLAARRGSRSSPGLLPGLGPWVLAGSTGAPLAASTGSLAAGSFGLLTLFLTFLKIGAVLFGSGYVLLAFLHADFVQHLHWLTDRQLVDAVAVGQLTPGPVFTTATFVGYLTGGWWGAAVATVAIFLPAFVYVPLAYRLLPWVRRSATARAFLDGATASGLGLMAAVTAQLGRTAVVDVLTAALALAAFLVLRRFGTSSAWLILGGGLVGLVAKLAAR